MSMVSGQPDQLCRKKTESVCVCVGGGGGGGSGKCFEKHDFSTQLSCTLYIYVM